jgi:hypothetical protein
MLELTPTATPAEISVALELASTKDVLTVPIGDPNKLLYKAPPIIPPPPFAPAPPDAPRMFFVRPLNGSATLTWLEPFSDGRSAITGFTITCAATGQPTVTNVVTASPWVMNGLANGVQYSCTVSASNALGTGPPSTARTVTARTTPESLTAPSATPAPRKANLAWTPPIDDGGAPIKGYVITCSTPGTDAIINKIKKVPATATTASVGGLINGAAYSCAVAARNAAGVGVASASTQVTPRTIPGAPQTPVVLAGSSSATMTFAAPLTNGGSVITGYTTTCVSTAVGATSPVSVSGSASPILVPGLTPGKRYTCKTIATNVAGNSRASSGKSVIPTL